MNVPQVRISPNPVADRATISFQLHRPGTVTGAVYDAAGNIQARLDAGSRPAGTHRLNLDVAGLAPGVYFCELISGAWTGTFRLTKSQ